MDTQLAPKVRLHVEDSGGPGRPVVLIHGWPLSGAAWAPQVAALQDAGYRVISYDRRGFGRSDKPQSGYDYDTLAADLAGLLEDLDLRDVTLVGFSMGGGEVARYLSTQDKGRLHSVAFASAVPPYMMRSQDNPEGPLTKDAVEEMEEGLRADRAGFFRQFARDFYTAEGRLCVPEEALRNAVALCEQSDQTAALACMEAFGTTDFREDLRHVDLPVLVIHGSSDGIVPIEGSGERIHVMVPGSSLQVIEGAPHGCNVSHPKEFNRALLQFLAL
ncbi:alpha/beta fold hydrolase [Salipiger marinus]|jgi:non-heme chloroperoxidase|uniref:alpha/beta fold hydrolase n=1 Tax=Salipiger marinus TaxID=555512 RepID=UPI00405A1B8E